MPRDGARVSRALASHGLAPAQLARGAALPQANAIYNFLHGRWRALSLEVMERILTALPDISFDELVGWKPYQSLAEWELVAPTASYLLLFGPIPFDR
jgi:hypothetical protein